jgi:hypothetical protein
MKSFICVSLGIFGFYVISVFIIECKPHVQKIIDRDQAIKRKVRLCIIANSTLPDASEYCDAMLYEGLL